jgi:hypothetical protein
VPLRVALALPVEGPVVGLQAEAAFHGDPYRLSSVPTYLRSSLAQTAQ